ncbi:MAG: SH3 domain-containing protein [Alphaproteobacteria bacterium]
MKIKAFLFFVFLSFSCMGQELPVPRFVSLRSNVVNMRSGPGERFPIEWVYKNINFPVEITDVYDTWYKIKDVDNTTGWIHKKMLTGKRYALTPKDKKTPVYKKDNLSSPIIGYFDGQIVIRLLTCPKENPFCHICYNDNLKGYVLRSVLYGLYPNEEID